MKKRAHVFVRGLVQGVGFRPFIYTIAVDNCLTGYVLNLGDAGVEIVIEGEIEALKKFIDEITIKKPSVARVEAIDIEYSNATLEFSKFTIAKSDEKKLTVKSVIPTDLSICDKCITDIYNARSRWYNYAFTSCAQCGPRFTITRKLPYDRHNTSMDDFPFCDDCQFEYCEPKDRRYDAQGMTCCQCGPRLTLLNKKGESLPGDPLKEVSKLLSGGSIIAIKGLGGFHIAVDATNELAVRELRKRRHRPSQPFAVMSRSIERISNFANINPKEKELLTNIYHPIITLKKGKRYNLSESVAPGLDTIGVMLPYTGIHLLLLDVFNKDAIIMTSGNYPGKPITIDNDYALKDLMDIVDFYLIHDRKIINRCDDSVIKVIENIPVFLRKSRGYSPSYLVMPWNVGNKAVVAVGGEFNVTGSVFIQDRVVTTQHIGDISELDTLDYLKNALNYIINIYNISEFSAITHDLNPAFQTSRYAKELAAFYKIPAIPIQHHHAHMAALMAENSLARDSEIVTIAIDGIGFGNDGTAWGGEIFLGGYSKFDRVAHLRSQPMPGGDICAYYPARMLAAILSTVMTNNEIEKLFKYNYARHLRHGLNELDTLLKQSKDPHTITTSSLGRLLDAIAIALNVCTIRTYEGEPPMRLEAAARDGIPGKINLELKVIKQNNKYIFDTSDFILSLMNTIKDNKTPDIAYEVHRAIGKALGEVACMLSDQYGITNIGLTGGSAVNSYLFKHIKEEIERNNKKLLFHTNYPSGDGCISLGQAVVASTHPIM